MFVLSCSWFVLLALGFWNQSLNATPFVFGSWIFSWSLSGSVFFLALKWSEKKNIEVSRAFVWLTTFGLALLHLSHESIFTTDLHRYLWDAGALLSGNNPLAFSPLELTTNGDLRMPLPPDHAEIPSLYPPLAMAFFLLGRVLHPAPIIFGILNLLLILASTEVLFRFLRRHQLPTSQALWFSWHPLLHLEAVSNGHVDMLGVFFLSLACVSFASATPKKGLVFLLLASWTKIWPWILSLSILKRRKDWKPWFFASSVFFVSLSYYFFVWGEPKGLLTYLRHWEFFGFFHSIFSSVLDPTVSRILCLLFFALAIFLFMKFPRNTSTLKTSFFLLASFLLCTPTLHPWYLLWLLPFFVWIRWSEWIYFSLAIGFSYAVLPNYLENGVWQEPIWAKFLIYTPLIFGILWRFRETVRSSVQKVSKISDTSP